MTFELVIRIVSLHQIESYLKTILNKKNKDFAELDNFKIFIASIVKLNDF